MMEKCYKRILSFQDVVVCMSWMMEFRRNV